MVQAHLEYRLCVLVVNQQAETIQHSHPHTRPGHVKRQVTCQLGMVSQTLSDLILGSVGLIVTHTYVMPC